MLDLDVFTGFLTELQQKLHIASVEDSKGTSKDARNLDKIIQDTLYEFEILKPLQI